MKITLPIPHKCLSPNHTIGSIGQRMQKSNAVKKYRQAAMMAATEEMHVSGMRPPKWKEAQIRVTWYSKTARLIDRDNIIAYLKSAFDGLTDSGLFADDRDVTHLPPFREKDAKNPRIEIVITNQI